MTTKWGIPPSDVYVRNFPCPFSFFNKTLLHKSSCVIKPGPWSQAKSSEIMNPTSFTASYHQVALVVKNPPAEAGDKET